MNLEESKEQYMEKFRWKKKSDIIILNSQIIK